MSPLRESLAVQDVALLAVRILDERDARGAVRIVLDLLHRADDAELVALEVDDAVLALVTAADAAHRDVAVIVAAAALLERLEQRLLGRRARDLGEIRDRAEARALGDRLELTNSHVLQPSKISIVSPSFSFTIAFFQRGRSPALPPTRRVLPRCFDVQTPVTCTPNSCSIACLIAGLFASGCTSNVYSPRSWYAAERLLGDDRPHDGAMQSRHRLLPLLLGRRLLRRRLLGRGLRGRLLRRRLLAPAPSSPAAFAFTAASSCAAAFAPRASPSSVVGGLRRLRARRRPSSAPLLLLHRRQRLAERRRLDRAPHPTRGCGTSRRR